MARIEKTVFISYRRTDVYTALAVYENLKNQGYDVFFDYTSISSGDFEQIITSNIRARAHFLIILTPTALDRCNEPDDWLRREIELAISEKRNIVPLFFKGFRFGSSSRSGVSKWVRFAKPEVMTGKLKDLSRYNGLNVHEDYFEEAMHRLRNEYLSKPLDTVLHPVSTQVRKVVKEEQDAADEALKQREVSKEPAKPTQEKIEQNKEIPKPALSKPERKEFTPPTPMKLIPWRKVGGIVGIFTVMMLCIWGGTVLWSGMSMAIENVAQTAEADKTNTPSPTITSTSQPVETNTPSPTLTPARPTPIATMVGKDGMTLLYVPGGEFTMGSDDEDATIQEKPARIVYLDAFWIDQTEVTNAMFLDFLNRQGNQIESGVAWFNPEEKNDVHLHSTGGIWITDDGYEDHPVVHVTWYGANSYCSWVDRRLPTNAAWEKAARGINGNIYPWGNHAPSNDLLNYNNADGTTEVGAYPNGASPFGALDMAGNVQEWVNDWFGANYNRTSPSSNPQGPSSGESRMFRDISWLFDTVYPSARSTATRPYTANSGKGFRCAMDASP